MTETAAPENNQRNSYSLPAAWADKYTDKDKEAVAGILRWLQANSGGENPKASSSVSGLARAAGVKQSTLHMSLNGYYTGSPTKFLEKVLDYIERENSRDQSCTEIPFTSTSVFKTVTLVCQRAHKYRNFGIVSGVVGVGKTWALKRYAQTHPSAIFIQGIPDMSPGGFLRSVMKVANCPIKAAYSWGTPQDMLEAIINHLQGSDRLLIVDEAEKIQPRTLEYVRRIADLAEIGCVLSGTEALQPLVRNPIGRHGQISSRVGFWPPIIKGITREDCELIIQHTLADSDHTATKLVVDAFWDSCEGKARVLGFLLLNVMELTASGKHQLSAALVVDVARQLMSIQKRRTA